MAVSTRSDFVDFIAPLRSRLDLYDPKRSPTDQPKNDAAEPHKAVPQGFIDAMDVREQVFVREQNIPLENEFDEYDARSFHWTAYASMPAQASSPDGRESVDGNAKTGKRKKSTSTKLPIGTIRLIGPPFLQLPNGKQTSAMYEGKESYAELGRLAVIKEFRKTGISRLLIETALALVKEHPDDLSAHMNSFVMESLKQEQNSPWKKDFRGLVLVHAQVGVQKVWRRYGFVTDESMGTWDEEGIQHVAMWKRVELDQNRRKSIGR